MTSLDAEIRSEVSKLRASEKEARILDAAFDEGRFAFVSGITRDGCRFRNPARRNAWERGWLASEQERAEHESIKIMTADEKGETRKKLSAMRAAIFRKSLGTKDGKYLDRGEDDRADGG